MPSTRDEIVRRLGEDRETWRSLLADVDPGQMREPGPMGDWSFHDLTSHLNRWRQRTIGRLEAAVAGAPRPGNPWPEGMDDDDPVNAWFREQDSDRHTADLLADYDASFDRAAGLVAQLPEDAFLGESAETPGYYRWRDTTGDLTSDFTNHLAGHLEDVRAWLGRA